MLGSYSCVGTRSIWKKSISSSQFNCEHRTVSKINSLKICKITMKIKRKHTLNKTAAAAKSLQSCPTLCDPIDGSPPGSPIPGILQARTLEWVAISFSNAWKWKVKMKSLSPVRLLAAPWTAAYQAPPPMGFSRQEYWSGVPLPSPTEIIINVILCVFFWYTFCSRKHIYTHTHISLVHWDLIVYIFCAHLKNNKKRGILGFKHMTF